MFWYEHDYKQDIGTYKWLLKKINIENKIKQGGMFSGFSAFTKDFGDEFIIDHDSDDQYWRKYEFSISCEDESRTDPILIKIIEEYGDENNGGCHKPRAIEIPDGVKWIVDEYDGLESLHEEHRVFG